MKYKIALSLLSTILVTQCRDTKVVDQLHSYFIANYKHFGKEWREALSWYKRAMALESPVFANKGLIFYLHDINNDHLIVKLKPIIEQHFKDDVEVQFILAQALANSGYATESQDLLIRLNQKAKTHQEIAFHVVQTLLERKEPENALMVIDSLLNNAVRKPTHFVFHFLKSQIYLQLNKKDEALASIKASLDLHPRFDKGWLLRALLEEKMGNLEQAAKGYTNFLELTGPNQEIEQHIIALAFKQKLQEQASPTIQASADCLAQALTLFKEKQYKGALTQLQKCLEQQPTNNEAKILKIQILTALNELDNALQDLKTWAVAEPNHTLWYNTLHLLYRNGIDVQKIIKTLHAIEKEQPEHLLPSLYLADMYLRTNSIHTATTYLHKCLKSAEDKALQQALVFQLSALAYNHNHIKKMKEYFATYQELMNNHAPWLNLMAYYFTHQEHDHTRAQELISKAQALDSNNPHILDTQAFIYFNIQQYHKALTLLQDIAQKEPNDYTITKHLAKTYYALGETQHALNELQRVIALAPNEKKEQKYKKLLVTWTKK